MGNNVGVIGKKEIILDLYLICKLISSARGLCVDLVKGNFLKIGKDGVILR